MSSIHKDRVIPKLPHAYSPSSSPYRDQNEFHPSVKQACIQHKTGTVGVRVFKAVIVGDVAVGKTCLVNRFCHDIFDRDYKATIGVDFEVEKFSILGTQLNLQIWDTAGQERFKSIASSYYRGAQALIVVFDISDVHTMNSVKQWMDDASKTMDDPIRFVIGAKKDLVSAETYKTIERDLIETSSNLNAEYWPTSSKTGENVKELFFRMTALLFNKSVLNEFNSYSSPANKKIVGSDLIKIGKDDNLYETKNKKKCCNH